MKLLNQAEQLLKSPTTLESMHEWDRLCKQARGDEAEHIADLYETLLNQASDDVYDAWMQQMADWAEAQE